MARNYLYVTKAQQNGGSPEIKLRIDPSLLNSEAIPGLANTKKLKCLRALSVIKVLKNAPDKDGNTPLHWAVTLGNDDTVKECLKFGCNTNQKNKQGITPFHDAVTHNKGKYIRTLLERGANIDTKDNDGNTALHHAIVQGLEDEVYILLKNKASVNLKNNFGETPLQLAKKANNVNLVQALLMKGGDANAKNMHGENPLDSYLSFDAQNQQVLKQMILETESKMVEEERPANSQKRHCYDFENSEVVCPKKKRLCKM